MLTVFNCGQGDALMISDWHCYFSDEKPLIIDLGPNSFTFPKISNEIDLLITHSHSDHINGNFSNKVNIHTLYIPAYFLEIQKIIQKLLNRKMPILVNKHVRHINILGLRKLT